MHSSSGSQTDRWNRQTEKLCQ